MLAPRPAAAGLLCACAPRLRGCGPTPQGCCCGRARARAPGALGGWSPLGPHPAPCALLRCGTSSVCALGAGRCAHVPAPFLAGRERPVLAPARSAWAVPGPLRARRPAAAAPRRGLRAALAPAALAPWPGLRGVRLAGCGPPCAPLRAALARPWAAPGGPLPVCAAAGSPWPSPCGPGLAPRPGSSRPGAVRPVGRFTPRPRAWGLEFRRLRAAAQPVVDRF